MYEIYQITFGDTLDSIADRVGTTIDELKKINKELNINPGSYIIVPSIDDNILGIYTVKKGDTPYSVAKQYNISVDNLMMLNGLNKDDYIYPNQQLIVPSKDTNIYITRQGDTLDVVANNFNDNIERIIEQNKKIYLLPDQLIMYQKMSIN